MHNAQEILKLGNVAIVAPAGHGKTEIIAQIAALGKRTLILTHTHAGVHAIRERLKRLSVPTSSVTVDTIAGWAMRYAHAFPKTACPPPDMPSISAVREVLSASYDRILIDEYQDCPPLQHTLTIELSKVVPTTIFGDPMQGIFEFAGATISWANEIHNSFPLAGKLDVPHRWGEKNPELGAWIAEVREKLISGDQIDLEDPRINFRVSKDAFDMSVLFEGIDEKEGSFTTIHCNKTICYRLASAARGGYQAIEEIAANRLSQFAFEWDQATDGKGRKNSISRLLRDCFNKQALAKGEEVTPDEIALLAEIKIEVEALDSEHFIESAKNLFALCRKHPRWRIYRSGLWKDAEHSLIELLSGRCASMVEAVAEIRQRMSHAGRKLPLRTVSTPLLLKGLEFDHVVVPDATHFTHERCANAKLFYVAISRATRSLTISAPSRFLQFDEPMI